jgi:tetratricopeptide (TPR) repeat protein
MTLFILSLALGTAFGRERLDEKPWKLGTYLGSVQDINLEKKIEVPGLIHKNILYLESKSGENERSWFFKVSTSSSTISVSDEFVKANNLKVQIKNQNLIPVPSDYGVGGQLKTVTIPILTIGEMTLTNVQAFVSSSKGKFDSMANGMQIGLGALDIAYTISPTKGTISFAPTSEGSALVSGTGTAISYERASWAQVKYGKTKKIAPARSLIITSKISGTDVLSLIEAGSQKKSTTAWELIPDEKNLFSKGKHLVYGTVKAPGVNTNGWLAKNGGFHFGSHIHDAELSRDILFAYELSVSPADQTLSLKKGDGNNWSSLSEAEIPYIKTQTEPDEEGNEAEASDWSALTDAYQKANQYQNALETAQKAVELAPEDCSNWDTLGDLQHKLTLQSEAQKSYSEASMRYHQWWDNDLDTRLEIQKGQAKLKKEEIETLKEEQKGKSLEEEDTAWFHKQSHTCHLTDGKLALINLANEQFQAVQKTYERLDLDPAVAIAQGNSALVQGNLDVAESAYRQAIRLEKTPSIAARYGLALFFADQGEWRFADPLFAEAFAINPEDAIGASLWFDNARANGEDTIQKASALLETYPQNNTVRFLLLREAKISGNTELLTQTNAMPAAISVMDNASTISTKARSLVILEKLDEATTLLDNNKKYADSSSVLVARADIAAASGDPTAAINFLKKAAQRDPSHPAMALFLK